MQVQILKWFNYTQLLQISALQDFFGANFFLLGCPTTGRMGVALDAHLPRVTEEVRTYDLPRVMEEVRTHDLGRDHVSNQGSQKKLESMI